MSGAVPNPPSEAIQARVKQALISLWAAGGHPTQCAIADESRKLGSVVCAQSVAACLTFWEARGVARLQPSGPGHPAAFQFNWTDRSWSDAAALHLGIVMDQYLAEPDTAVPLYQKQAVRSALRVLLNLPDQCPPALILTAAAAIGVEAFHGIAGVVSGYLRNRPSDTGVEKHKKLASNYQSAIRAALRYVGDRGLVPICFPDLGDSSIWLVYRNMIFGAPVGKLTRKQSNQRRHWSVLATFAEARFPGLDPKDYTLDQFKQVREDIIRGGKEYAVAYGVWGMRRLGRDHGIGPFAEVFKTQGHKMAKNGRINAGYLVSKKGTSASDGEIKELIALVMDNGFGPEWDDFLTWYHDYSTLTAEEIEADPERYPDRWEKRRLSHNTWVRRAGGLRAWLHQALLVTGLPAADLTPGVVYGQHFRKVLAALKAWWKARAETGAVSDAGSEGLVGIIKGATMIARALYDRSRHEAGRRQAVTIRSRPDNTIEETVPKTPTEQALWDAYTHGRVALDRFEKARAFTATGGQKTTRKDLRRIVRDTPHTYWIAILDDMHAEIQRRIERGHTDDLATHRLVRDAVFHGLLISTGCRRGELCHVRLDVQFSALLRESRQIHLRPVDRKNETGHVVAVHERYLPQWLLDHYLGRTRPWFMGEHRLAKGKQPAVHQHLLVMNNGMAFGCSEEQMDGSGRKQKAFTVRKGTLGNNWKRLMRTRAARLHMHVVTEWGEGACHAVRNAVAAAIALEKGFLAAAHYLGDDVETVRDTYGFLDGTAVDATDLAGVCDIFGLKAEGVGGSGSANNNIKERLESTTTAQHGVLALHRKLDALAGEVASGGLEPGRYKEQVSRLEAALQALR